MILVWCVSDQHTFCHALRDELVHYLMGETGTLEEVATAKSDSGAGPTVATKSGAAN